MGKFLKTDQIERKIQGKSFGKFSRNFCERKFYVMSAVSPTNTEPVLKMILKNFSFLLHLSRYDFPL